MSNQVTINEIIDLSKPQILVGLGLIVHFQNEGSLDYNMAWSGAVYQAAYDSEDLIYYGKDARHEDTTDHTKAVCWYEFSFCYRGVWEGRIYFKNEEFWHEDLATIHESWGIIQASLQKKIAADNPDYAFED